MVHLARSTPPSLVAEGLGIFDRDIRRCFTECTSVDVSDVAWMQAQLSPSRGGLGLRSLRLHSSACFIASMGHFGIAFGENHHLEQSLIEFNGAVEGMEGIGLQDIIDAPPHQRQLSSMIEDHQFKIIFDHTSSPANCARLLSVSSPHASAWLSVMPTPHKNLHLDPPEFQMALKWWLGLDTSQNGSSCSFCPSHALDPLGHHALTCKSGGDSIFRHNSLRDAFWESCKLACIAGQIEAGSGLDVEGSRTRPADILLPNWEFGKPAALDFTITSALNPSTLNEASVMAGSAASAAEVRKHVANDEKCSRLGWVCVLNKYIISVETKHCPPGYVLQNSSFDFGLSCMCDIDANIVNCEPGLKYVLLKPSLWVVAVQDITLKTYRCPNGYCIQIYNTSAGPNTHGSVYTYNSPEAQCNCNRSGVLCGSCPQGCGVSVLTNKCVTCGNENGLLILALCVVVVTATIIIVIYPYPIMAGFYPCLFAIQLAPLISEEFPISFESIHPYLYYISSFLALYFPYDFCLLNNLNPLASYCLRYTPPLLVSLTVVITLVIRKKLHRLYSIPWYGVWTLVLLLYTQAVHTSMSVLNCPLIQDSNGYTTPRWYVDGTVECFTQGHLPLALFSILALVLEAGLIPLVVMISMEKLKQPAWVRQLVQPLTDAFKEDWRWWGAMELARRFLLLLFTLPFPGNPIPPSYLLMAYLCAYAFIQPYKSAVVNLVEVALCVDLLVMLLIVGDSAITEDLLYSHTTQLSISQSNQDGCVVSGFTRFTGLLTPFYYLPLLVGVVCVAISVASLFRVRSKPPQREVEESNQWSNDMLPATPITTNSIELELHASYTQMQSVKPVEMTL
eukprot:Em0005g797a